jgi:hypothetical protein
MLTEQSSSNRRSLAACLKFALPALLFVQVLPAADLSIGSPCPPQNVAFARYVASLQGRYLNESGQLATLIQGSLPGLYKEAEMIAIRQTGGDQSSQYNVLYLGGDGTVADEVIARYFEFKRQVEKQPLASTLISPENYNFHFRGQVKTGGGNSYIYDITPRKKRLGLMKGQIWIDATTGAEVVLAGRIMDKSGEIDLVRETKLVGESVGRVTHVGATLPLLGRGELVVVEFPVLPDGNPGNSTSTTFNIGNLPVY